MKNFYIIIFSIFTTGVIFFTGQGVSKAAEWPGNEWGPGTDMEIMLSKNKNHKSDRGTKIKFAYYAKNDQGQKRITFVQTKCGSRPGTYALAQSGVDIKTFSNGSCGNKTLDLGKGSDANIPGENYTKYEVFVWLNAGPGAENDDPYTNPDLAVFRFGVDYDNSNGNFVGYLRDGTTSLAINSRLNNNEEYLPSDLRIKVACDAGSKSNGTINFYDSDNNKDLFSQPEKGYTPVKYKVTDTILEHTDSLPNGWGYNVNNNFWWPIDTSSSSLRTARIAIPSDNKDRYFVIRSLGQGNYTILDLPFDETRPNCDPPPKCPAPYDYLSPPLCPKQEKFNWAVVPSANVNKNIALLGETVKFTQTQSGATGSDGWKSDEHTSDRVDANIITTKDGNIINSTDFHTDAGGVIAKSKPENITLNQTGVYCQYINYPVGFLGKRKTPNYRSTGYTYRWVYIPSRDDNVNTPLIKENMTVYNPAYDTNNPPRAIGGYDQWWLASTTDDTPESDNGDGFNQYWAFHNFNDPGSAWDGQDGSSGMWRWYGGSEVFSGSVLNNWLNYGYRTDAGHPTAEELRHPWEVYGWWNPNGTYVNYNYDGPKACVTVVDPAPQSETTDYEKNVIDHEIKHTVTLGLGTCPPFTTPVDIEARGEDGTVFYDETVTASFSGGSCSWSYSPVKKIPYATLNGKPPGYSVTYSTVLGINGKPSIKSFKVVEVPFARFYGNDVYSTNGQIKFNDSDNANSGTYDSKGSVAQYAAFASAATNYLDSAGYRLGLALPNPPTGLSSNNFPFHTDVNATKAYNAVVDNMHIDCAKNPYAGGAVPGSGCFVASTNSINIGGAYNTKTTIKAANVVINSNITNSSFDPSNTIGATLYKHPTGYGGPNLLIDLPAGSYNKASLISKGLSVTGSIWDNNGLSGVDIKPGYRVTLFKGDNFTGQSLPLNATNLNFNTINDPIGGLYGWNNTTQSLIIEKTAPVEYEPANTGVLLIAADKIYINKDVQRVDAILVAKEVIYTCANPASPATIYANSTLDENCRTTLTVNGSVSAPKIAFQRVGGSRYLNQGNDDTADGSSNCSAWAGIKNCDIRGAIDMPSGKTAEIINFPAYLYWAKPYLVNQAGSGGTYDKLNLSPPRQ